MSLAKSIRTKKTQHRSGFTLIELLVASTIGLAVMASVATLFGLFGRAINDGNDISAMSARLRSAAWKLRQDLGGITTEVKPWLRPEACAGYFELIEGPLKDADAAHGTTTIVADVDDVLMFTTRSSAVPFVGQLGTTLAESNTAEVAWFCKPSGQMAGTQPLYNLHRRQLLVSAYLGSGTFATTHQIPFSGFATFLAANDVSVRREQLTASEGYFVLNSLADLTRRESRFLHNIGGTVSPAAFPYRSTIAAASATVANGEILTGTREGEDVVLSNVIAFDVRIFDPEIPATAASRYVDLGAGNTTVLTRAPATKSKMLVPTYDTWSMHYESNGLDEDGAQGVDQGTNGVDNNGNTIIDEIEELETAPPYAVPLKGLEIRIRCYDPTSRQVRQTTVRHSFEAR